MPILRQIAQLGQPVLREPARPVADPSDGDGFQFRETLYLLV